MRYLNRTEPWVPGKKITIEVSKELHAAFVKKISDENSNIKKKMLELIDAYVFDLDN